MKAKKVKKDERSIIAERFFEFIKEMRKENIDDDYTGYVVAGICLSQLRRCFSNSGFNQLIKEYIEKSK